MTTRVCLASNVIDYPQGGGHLWVFLNWALGLKAHDCDVTWLSGVSPETSAAEVQANLTALKCRLQPYGMADQIVLYPVTDEPLQPTGIDNCLGLEAASQAELLLSFDYSLRPEVVATCHRAAFVEIDPGELQIWLSKGLMHLPVYDVYFTIGETVGQPGARFPDAGLSWQYTPPCVALDWWHPRWASPNAPFTTVAHWYFEWMEDEGGGYDDSKREGFLPFLDLPRLTTQPLELAIDLVEGDEDHVRLWDRGWRVQDSRSISSTPWDYQHYIEQSRGEFSCVKPHCVRLQNAWISDRTLCYLASGKPAVVEHTGPSRFLPDAAGLFRFRTLEEAVRALDAVAGDYEHQCRLARRLAEEYFDARKVVGDVLARALA